MLFLPALLVYWENKFIDCPPRNTFSIDMFPHSDNCQELLVLLAHILCPDGLHICWMKIYLPCSPTLLACKLGCMWNGACVVTQKLSDLFVDDMKNMLISQDLHAASWLLIILWKLHLEGQGLWVITSDVVANEMGFFPMVLLLMGYTYRLMMYWNKYNGITDWSDEWYPKNNMH